jgi:hypothetical protein
MTARVGGKIAFRVYFIRWSKSISCLATWLKLIAWQSTARARVDTRITLTPYVIHNSNYVIMISDRNCLKYFCVFFVLWSSGAERLSDHSVCSNARYYGAGKSDYVFGEGIMRNLGGRGLFVPVSRLNIVHYCFRISKYLEYVSLHTRSNSI